MAQKRFCLLGLLFATTMVAQFDPEGAQVISYFPHLADGGPPSQRWTTTLTFVNPHSSFPAAAVVNIFGDDGNPLSLDFGNGPASIFSITVPPQGTLTLRSSSTSATTVTGWAIVRSTLPLEGVVQFRYSTNGVPQQGVSSNATAPSAQFRSPATASTGIAIANKYPSLSLPVSISAIDSGGATLATSSATLPPLGHKAFTVGQMFRNLPGTFRGSVVIETSLPARYFVAWTLSSDSGVISSYSPSGIAWPVSQEERIWKVWWKLLNVAAQHFSDVGSNPPKLVIDPSTAQLNSYANPAQNEVHIFLNLADLISDSESELSFVVGHEIGHIIQARIGNLFVAENSERDADQHGMLLSLLAGYDPYGGRWCPCEACHGLWGRRSA